MVDNASKVTFGGYDLEKYALPGQSIEYHDITPNP